MADRVGFEPTNTFWDVTHFPGERLRPLGHLSTQARKGTGRGSRYQFQPLAVADTAEHHAHSILWAFGAVS